MTADARRRDREVPRRAARHRLLRHPASGCASQRQPVPVHRPPGALHAGHRRARRGRRARGFKGLDTRRDPVRDYPADDVAANLVGFLGRPTERRPGRARAHLRHAAVRHRRLGAATRSAAATGSRWRRAPSPTPIDGQDLRTTIDRDLQWYTQRVLAPGRRGRPRPTPASRSCMDTRTGEVLALADYPTFDANQPLDSPEGRPRLARAERRLRAGLGARRCSPSPR